MTRSTTLIVAGVIAAAALEGCSDTSQVTGALPVATRGLQTTGTAVVCKPPTPDALIPLPLAPLSQRVDLGSPTFGNPTNVTNPLFPISQLSQVVLVGVVGGVPFRAETTLLPGTQRIRLGDKSVTTLVSQYVAYLDRRLDETALDWYAQDDDGAVWYFGEDVANYEDGEVVDNDGTWLACKDGPIAMIMPATPSIGNVYRVENIYPTVFEEIEVVAVGQTVAGPLGAVSGAFTVQQLHLDGSYAPKVFAPGYGEFSTGDGIDVEALALAIPTDASPLPSPASLLTLLRGSRLVFNNAKDGKWIHAARNVDELQEAWARHQAGAVPRLLKPLMDDALNQLAAAVDATDRSEARQYALDVSKVGLDLLLRHQSRVEVDFLRLDLWVRQLIIDTEARDAGGAASDMAILKTILYRLTDAGSERDRHDVRRLQQHLGAMQSGNRLSASTAVLAGARHLQAILSDRVRAHEG